MSEKIKVSKINQLRYKSWDIKTVMIEKWQVVLLVSLFWAGMIIGCIYINKDGDLISKIEKIIESGYAARGSYTSLKLFFNALFTHGIFLLFVRLPYAAHMRNFQRNGDGIHLFIIRS